jgi:hypothetical protein
VGAVAEPQNEANGQPEPPAVEPPVVSSATKPVNEATTAVRGFHGQVTVEFIQHAVERMIARGATKDEVLAWLRVPDKTNLPADAGRKRFWRCRPDATNRGLNVVFEVVAANRIRIVSVWYSGPR